MNQLVLRPIAGRLFAAWILFLPALSFGKAVDCLETELFSYDVLEPYKNFPRVGDEVFYLAGDAPKMGGLIPYVVGKEPMRITQLAADGETLELSGLMGERIYVHCTRTSPDRLRFYSRIRREEVPFQTRRYSPMEIWIEENEARKMRRTAVPATAESLAEAQMEGSGTVHWDLSDREAEAVAKTAFVSANQDMLDVLRAGGQLTVNDLLRWHQKGTADEVPSIIRGSDYGSTKPFDVEIGSEDNEGRVIFYYSSARKVPSRLSDLLARINQLDAKSTVIDVAKIYQTYIAIHPFVNGNGRTSRILLDFMVQKIGLPPVRHAIELRDILYQPAEEVATRLIQSYLP